jgi:hypothetical protein
VPAIDPGSNRNATKKRKVKVRAPKATPAPKYKVTVPDAKESSRTTQLHPVTPDQADRQRGVKQQAHDKAVTKRVVRVSREKAVAKKGAGSGTRAIKRELEGKGVIAHVVSYYGNAAAKSVDPAAKVSTDKHASVTDIPNDLPVKVIRDLVNLPAQTIPSLYVPAAGAVEAARGHPQRLKQLGKDISQHDPLYNTAAAGVSAATGHMKAAEQHLKRAKQAAVEHPGYTAAEFYGARGAVGRTAGAVVRGAAKVSGSKALKRIGTTKREPRTLPGTNIEEQRSYSKDLSRKAGQVRRDLNAKREAERYREAAKSLEPDARAELERKARQADPTLLNDRDIARRVDKHVDAVEQVRREHRTKATAEAQRTVRKVRKAGPVANLLTQRIVRPHVEDLRAYVKEIEAEHAGLGPAARRANEKLRHEITKAIARAETGKVDLAAVNREVKAYVRVQNAKQQGLVKRGMLAGKQAEKARRIPYSIRRLGAHYDDKPRLSETGLRKFITGEERKLAEKGTKKARKVESAALRDLRQSVANARVSVAHSKTSGSLRNAEREQRSATANLARTRRAEQTQRKVVAVRVSKAEARRVKTERNFLRSDKTYRDIEKELRQANSEKRRLRDEVRQAEGTGKRGPRGALAAASQRSRTLAYDLTKHAETLRTEPLVRDVAGVKTLAPRARVLRAERSKIAPKATETKPAERVVGAKQRVAQAERAVATERRRIRGVAPKEADALLGSVLERDQARARTAEARAKETVARAAHIAAKKAGAGKKDKVKPGIVDEHGRPISLGVMRESMGGEEPAYLSQAPNARGARNFYVQSGKPPKATGMRRTGEATRKGTFDAHPDTLVEQAARTQGLIDAFDHFKEFVSEFSRHEGKKIVTRRTKKEADQLSRDLSVGGTQWTPVRVNPLGATKEQLTRMLEEGGDHAPLHEAMTDALAGKDGPGDWAIVPKAAADRMQEHLKILAPGNSGRVARKMSASFRKTVLATSPKWAVNNAVEAGVRSALARAGIRSYITGRRVLATADRMDPARAEMLRARTTGGGHYSMADRVDVHFDVEKLTDSTVKDVARPLTAFWKAPGPKHAAGAWHAWTHFVFNIANKMVEQQFQTAMLGKAVRDQLLDDNLLKLSTDAINKAARGALDRNTAVALGDAVDRMYGRYGKLRPDERKAIALYTPFVMWAQNAAYFVTRTLPQDHPVALTVAAAAANAEQEWLKTHGLDQFITDRLPGFLQGSVPGKDGVKYRSPTNSLPFGFFSDPTGSLASLLLPQVSSAKDAFEGRDWKGKPLRNPDGSEYNIGQRAKAAGAAFLGGTIPILAVERQVAKGPRGQLNSITGRTAPKAADPPTLNPPKIKTGGSFGGSYGSGSFGKGSYGSSYGGSSFK